ncbi:hypothetical protein ACHZG8_001792 [Yersinia enterocolitica]
MARELSHTLRNQDKITQFGVEEFIMLFTKTDEKTTSWPVNDYEKVLKV